MQITVSAIKADIGGIGGHTRPSDELLETVRNFVAKNSKGLLIDHYIGYTGDDIHIIMTHTRGVDDEKIHKLAWDAFTEGTKTAKEQGLYGAGQDLLKDSFSGNVKGMGPGVAEIEMEERPSEVFCIFAADKTEPGAFNFPLWRMFVDARSNSGLLINERLAEGVVFRIMDVMTGKVAELKMWQDKAELEAALMYPGRYVVHSVVSADGTDQIVSASTDRLHNIAGTYVGKDDPIAIVRTQKNFPATEEAGSAFNDPHYVAGNTRGSHHMPLMPVKLNSAASLNYSIPIVSCLLFSMHNGKLTGPHDGFGTADWDLQRMWAAERAMIMRNQGFIHPATLVPDELEYNKGYEARMSKLESKFRNLEDIMNGKTKKAATKAKEAGSKR
ncbi:MAG: fructose-1,6-bisphosphate aldolase/phosphatase [Nitrososphaera sp.]|uniref:Fructose-1,6-bisphosphate aldolase/phosphatase n=1 Tax=Nitrososphaera gargensis (strain Ga9.2) TaxID=1237085 RepID=K0I7L4_NITGG|nr:fructose-1,6-bisphosphate aldolase/phosphatase [Candidatus Nitrososphaera gargensis]AFU57241.1 bifunctional fructose-1,6-bisphosphatase [Candidatus Nitrososphaera gargensis Ga9.2]